MRLELFQTAMGRTYLVLGIDAVRKRPFKRRIDNDISSPDDEKQMRLLLPEIERDRIATRGDRRGVDTSSIATLFIHVEELLAGANIGYCNHLSRNPTSAAASPAQFHFAGSAGAETGRRLEAS